jgi:hypothetical protein
LRLRRRSLGLFGLFAALPLRLRSAPALDSETSVAVLAAMAFELFPHESVPRARFDALAYSFSEADSGRAAELAAAVEGAAFLAQPRAQRIARMEAVQARPDFQALRMHVLLALYTDLAVIGRFGYQGPSLEQGGYLTRGFDDARWVPEPGSDAR